MRPLEKTLLKNVKTKTKTKAKKKIKNFKIVLLNASLSYL